MKCSICKHICKGNIHQIQLHNASFGETMRNKKLDHKPNATTVPYIFGQPCLLPQESLSGHFHSQVNNLYLIKLQKEHFNSI